MGETGSSTLIMISDEMGILLSKGIAITAEYLPSVLNQRADWQSRLTQNSSEWQLLPQIFSKIKQVLGQPGIDLFASRLSNLTLLLMETGPLSQETDATQQNWLHQRNHLLHALLLFALISVVLKKVVQNKESNTDYAYLAHSVIIPRNINLRTEKSLIIEQETMLLRNPQEEGHSLSIPYLVGSLCFNPPGQGHPLVGKNSLTLVAWKISDRAHLNQVYHRQLPHLSPMNEIQTLIRIIIRLGVNVLADVSRNS